MKNKRSHIKQAVALFLLCVFAIALTPWSSFHHHEKEEKYCGVDGEFCSHKVHVKNQVHSCLICSAHFIKDYCFPHELVFKVNLQCTILVRIFATSPASYTLLIGTSLRGPPLA
ncbi:hypothetical protein [Arcticibacter eurypsychrophilus]|uniref:hypothetical protein n=1 Tax=Arcticibacter eurypsychrophilus TaxID=1434752 RepID=UPI00084CF7AA|nr:hypothetical protein [Arcticibacter eurypsychrophilus]